jgi:hypothetical protein
VLKNNGFHNRHSPIYRLIAALSLDFTSGRLDPRITFSRTTNATLTNSAGLVANAPMNLLTFSEQFDNAAWRKTGISVTANQATAPNGTTTADLAVVASGAQAQVQLYEDLTALTPSATYTISAYVKKSGTKYAVVGWMYNTLTYGAVAYDLDTQTVSRSSAAGGFSIVSSSIVDAGDGWYRISVVATVPSTAALSRFPCVFPRITEWTSGAPDGADTGNGVSGIYIWGAQLNVGDLQPYNPTTVKNLLGFTENFDNAAWTKSNAFVQTNLLTYSQNFDNASWTKTNATVAADATTAPNNTQTADRVSLTAAGPIVRQTHTTTTVGAYTASVWIKSDSSTSVTLSLRPTGAGSPTSVVVAVTTEWQRFSVSFTAASGVTNIQFWIEGFTQTIDLWGAQLVQGTTPGDYKATYAAAAAVGYTDIYGQPFAQKLVEDTVNTTHFTRTAAITLGFPVAFSCYMKAAERSWGYLQLSGSGSVAYFNLATGSVGTSVGCTPYIENLGNGWYRCSVVDATTTSAFCIIGVTNADGNLSYTGDGTSGIYIFGAQLSDSASVDPYVYNPVAAPTSTAYYGPRFDYDPVTLAPKGLLIEEQRTNRTLQSENFTAAPWSANVSTTSTRVNDSNSYGFMLGRITATSANGGIRQQHAGLTSGQVYALSFYIQSTTTAVSIVFENGTANFGAIHAVTINPLNGTAGALSGFTSVTITPFASGYIYTLITAPAGGALVANLEWRIVNNGDSILLGRPQFEAGAFATSYIPTVASQVTRAADSASMIGNNFARWFNQTVKCCSTLWQGLFNALTL